MTPLLWTLIAIQIAMGAFDTFYHHEMTERLAWRPSQRYELRLHGVRPLQPGLPPPPHGGPGTARRSAQHAAQSGLLP